ncbi:class I SAM-dependent DNA methyltransferase [Candidatus Jidaibacter acanthamoebae]|nr:class I SAM-dependent methyltransferase [Candidatus Jidaibacter acanthamoeba]
MSNLLKNKQPLFDNIAIYYDLLYDYKNYKLEVLNILDLIKQFRKASTNTLLDVGCGPGRHLQFFRKHFNCMGIDVSSKMLKIAKKNAQGVIFQKADMTNMNLHKKFDVITCLFSTIGYTSNYTMLKNTWQNFYNHLNEDGIIIVEPWFNKETYKIGYPYMKTYESEEVKIARVNIFECRKNVSILDCQYLIGIKNKKLKVFRDMHELGLFDINKTLKIITNIGLTALYLEPNSLFERGIYIAVKK